MILMVKWLNGLQAGGFEIDLSVVCFAPVLGV